MRVNFGKSSINNQPFKIGVVYDFFEDMFPYALVAPSFVSLMNTAELAVLRGQVTPRRTCSQYPK
jgi:hypothetical protein